MKNAETGEVKLHSITEYLALEEKSFPIHTLGFEINMADLFRKVPNLKNPQINFGF